MTRTADLIAAHVDRRARERQDLYTPSERALEEILETMAGGQLRGQFCHEFPIKSWILDFYFFEVRVGIEVDGGYHAGELQRDKDEQKTADCEGVGITILRVTNDDVLGDRRALEQRILRAFEAGRRRTGGRFITPKYTRVSLRGTPKAALGVCVPAGPPPGARAVAPGGVPEGFAALTHAEAILLKRHGRFYHELDTGKRLASNQRQREFVEMCRGRRPAQTEHELAYAKLISIARPDPTK